MPTLSSGRSADPPELMVLDLMLPSLDGLEVCRQLRLAAPVPVIMLTARDEEGDRIAGLELGADDYVAKPFSPRELTARVKAVLRRTSGPLAPALPNESELVAGDVRVDTEAHCASVRGEPVALTAREYELLVHLMRHPAARLPPRGASRRGLGIRVRRRLDRDSPRAAASREDREGPGRAAAHLHGVGIRLQVRTVITR